MILKIKNTRDTMSETYHDALKIRQQVFVKEQKISYALEMDSLIEETSSIHFVLYDDLEKACATCRLLTQENSCLAILQRMAVLKEERGKGYARLLVNAALTFAKDHEITEIVLHAQLTARGLYEKLGFIPEGQIFEEAGIQHITMRKTIWRDSLSIRTLDSIEIKIV